ncbi:MAG: sodium:calcium antiporter [Acidimicrobiia bacterium]|nr:MAG: sodium:calcium antiporter [Acidimicrobiia bacterium]
MLLAIAAVAFGVLLLAYAADQFVIGAAALARLLRVPAVVVGVVVVGFGTSAPELLVSLLAAGQGRVEVAAGNVLGSNLANLSLLLGIGALITPLTVTSGVVRREAPLALVATGGLGLAMQVPNRLLGALLVAAMVIVVVVLLKSAMSGRDPVGLELDDLVTPAVRTTRVEVLRTGLGLVGTLAGAQALLWGALDLAGRAGLSEGFVGLTMVAVGTSLPELVTVVQSARRHETDLVLGNLLGSNLFNALFVGGLAMTVEPALVDDVSVRVTAVIAATVCSVIVWWFLHTGRRVSRVEAVALIVGYFAVVPVFV